MMPPGYVPDTPYTEAEKAQMSRMLDNMLRDPSALEFIADIGRMADNYMKTEHISMANSGFNNDIHKAFDAEAAKVAKKTREGRFEGDGSMMMGEAYPGHAEANHNINSALKELSNKYRTFLNNNFGLDIE